MSEVKIKQSLIDRYAEDFTERQLATMLVELRAKHELKCAEAEWLDALADALRNGENGQFQEALYADYEEEQRRVKEIYYINQKNQAL